MYRRPQFLSYMLSPCHVTRDIDLYLDVYSLHYCRTHLPAEGTKFLPQVLQNMKLPSSVAQVIDLCPCKEHNICRRCLGMRFCLPIFVQNYKRLQKFGVVTASDSERLQDTQKEHNPYHRCINTQCPLLTVTWNTFTFRRHTILAVDASEHAIIWLHKAVH